MIHARYVIKNSRLSDRDRALWSEIKDGTVFNGKSTNALVMLDRYIVLRYESIELAEAALAKMKRMAAVSYASYNGKTVLSLTPNDYYYQGGAAPEKRQWGLGQMNFSGAWDASKGQAHIGILDADFPGNFSSSPPRITPHVDLAQNYRPQLSPPPSYNSTYQNHSIHVSGIAAAQFNNSIGVAGACPDCSFSVFPTKAGKDAVNYYRSGRIDDVVDRMKEAINAGMQVINWSGGAPTRSCSTAPALCDVLRLAKTREILVVIAAGNNDNRANQAGPGVPAHAPNEPHFPANLNEGTTGTEYPVLAIGGTDSNGSRWTESIVECASTDLECGSNYPTIYGVMAPAKRIVSTFGSISATSGYARSECSDASSNPTDVTARSPSEYNNGYGGCTGTSMSAPFISGLAGLVRSVDPRATVDQVRQRIRQGSSHNSSRSAAFGSGIPNAGTIVGLAVQSNPTKLTPLFSFYSSSRLDSFYTTVPQMGRAALEGTLQPKNGGSGTYIAAYGSTVSGYMIPGQGPVFGGSTVGVNAEVWIFTTSSNPKNASTPLTPIYRMSWKCGDYSPYLPSVCDNNANHVDTTLVMESEVAYFKYLGYLVDGIEGFVYPRTLPQPAGTIQLMRMYNASRDDHAVFPATAYSSMYSSGYTAMSNSINWLGYAYPNSASMPSVP